MPARKGDGTGLSFKDFSEVRKGDGTVFWTDTNVPDSGDLHAHYDATKISASDGDNISTWSDETGNGYDLTQSTSSSQPTFKTGVINNNPVVRFDGSSEFLDVVFSTLSQANHIFIVFQFNNADAYMFDSEDSSERNAFYISTAWVLFSTTGLSGSNADTNPHIGGFLFNGSNSALRLDGSVDVTGNSGSDGLNGFTVGRRNNDQGYAEVDIAEILIYPQDKSSVQADIENYLSDKWGVAI